MKRVTSIGLGVVLALASSILVSAQTSAGIVKGGMLKAKAISLPIPEYPDEAKTAEVGGTVRVEIILDESGSVISARAVHGTINASPEARQRPGVASARWSLDKAAVKAARESKFAPTVVNGLPVQVSGFVMYEFEFGNPPFIYDNRVLNGKAKTMPMPTYPEAARLARVGGTVLVEIIADKKGDVISAKVVSGHKLLWRVAVEAAKQAKFWPLVLDGVPMTRGGVLRYEFALPDES
ncbi:MAG TPA: energy transducer TonB [Pyrinomonadaceae bacterium]|nr:energy transducer TonB [Pyrinomonadaceae bacterium]